VIYVTRAVIPNHRADLISLCPRLLLGKAELPVARFRDLRRTHATPLLERNVPVRIAQEPLGHHLGRARHLLLRSVQHERRGLGAMDEAPG
jgi:integrase